GGALAGAGGASASGACAAPVASAPAVPLADFEQGAIPTSDSAPKGFRGSDVARGTIIMPGANGTAKAARFSFATDDSLFYQSATRPMYLGGSATYDADLANALQLWMRIPAGSPLLAASGGLTFSIYTYHWRPGDPWVGTNAGGANLTDSQMHGYGPMRFDPDAADRWIRVVMSASAFDHSRGNYHFYAAQAVAEDKTFFGTLRQFQPVFLAPRTGAPTVDLDELSLVTLPPTAAVCPPSYAASVPASGGDVVVPVVITNPTSQARSYHAFVSSVIGLDRQTIEVATHDADDVSAVDNLQAAVGSDGGLGAARLFADDGAGKPAGPDLLAAGGAGITIGAGASFHAVLVHHVTAAMLGPPQTVMNAGHSYDLRRDTLTTSLVVWDPLAARVGDVDAVFTGSNADTSHPAPPGFPPFADPPAGWHSADVPPDQVGGYFVSVLRLTP
ncbi:MAG TPA: hypothetical protein VHL80_04385, partial [Polyangia bacterium]|nr:hypothetical protein [Polyangia bacterium]